MRMRLREVSDPNRADFWTQIWPACYAWYRENAQCSVRGRFVRGRTNLVDRQEPAQLLKQVALKVRASIREDLEGATMDAENFIY